MRLAGMKHQKGAVLILMFVSMILTFTAVILAALNNRNGSVRELRIRQEEMQDIKEFLLGFAMNEGTQYGNGGPGRLPCPSTTLTGVDNCSGSNFGRLARSIALPAGGSLQISASYAYTSEQYWYAVDPRFKAGSIQPLIPFSGLLSIDGTAGYVAVIVAPGEAILSQNRSQALVASNFLEGGNESGLNFVSKGAGANNFNDAVIGISDSELLTFASAKAAVEIQQWLNSYHDSNSTYPVDTAEFVSAVSGASSWLNQDGWLNSGFTYTPVSANQAQFSFDSCNIVFTLNFGTTAIQRSPKTC